VDHRLRSRLVAGVALAVAAAVALAMGWRWLHRPTPARVDRAVRQWAAARALALSDSVYRLTLGRLRFQTAGIGIDSLALETDSARNARRPRPLPNISLVLRGGHVEGVDVQILLSHRYKTVVVAAIRFDSIEADVKLPPPAKDSTRAPTAARAPAAPASGSSGVRVLELGPGAVPTGAPNIRVGRIELPRIGIAVHPANSAQGQVQRLSGVALELDRVFVDTRNSSRTPIYAGDIRLRAEHYVGVWSWLAKATAAKVEASLRDSLFRVDGLEVRPTVSDAELRRRSRWRRTRIAVQAARVEAHGVDYAKLLGNGGVAIRTIEVGKPNLDLLLEKNLSPNPKAPPAPLPHRVMRQLRFRLTVDSIRAQGGTISYGELNPGKPRPGVVTFERLEGSIRNLSNDPARMSTDHPMVLTASTKLMGSGHLATVLEIPLLADSFRVRYRGTVGPMPLTDFNRFAAINTGARLRSGEVLGLSFDARVIDDYATGRVIPQYRDLKLGLTERGGGIVGAVKRHVGSFFANNFKLRRDNPEDGDPEKLAVGRISRRRLPPDDLFPFLWFSLRDAIKQVMTP